MAKTEWWQRGPIVGVPEVLQPVAHIVLPVRESFGQMVTGLTEAEWNAQSAGVASAALHARRIAGVIDRLFTDARGEALSDLQRAALARERGPVIRLAEVPTVLADLDARVDAAVTELKALN